MNIDQPRMLGYAKKDKWVGPFLKFVGGRMATIEEISNNTTLPMVFSGISKTHALHQAQKHGLDWWYIDTGYFGNPYDKVWFRITKNSHQNIYPVQPRPSHRLDNLKLDTTRYSRGNKIMIVPPDDKVCSAYDIESSQHWIDQTIQEIKKYTDREIVIRDRPLSRQTRRTNNKFVDALQQDINAVVFWTSNCGVESVQHGIPVVSLGPSACHQISQPIENIDNLHSLDQDLVRAWMCWLSYNQFTKREMSNGTAWRILNE
jgi:hypothetical protein